MKLNMQIIDVFSSKSYHGNPAAVLIIAEWFDKRLYHYLMEGF